jgi:AcrR family transcriptional regulator
MPSPDQPVAAEDRTETKVETKADAMKQRILVAFEAQARTIGPRGVVMAELVRELGISTKTLYRHFPTKANIVAALMQSWAQAWIEQQHLRMQVGLDPRSRIEQAAIHWLDHTSTFSDQFWLQLERDFPEAYVIYQSEYASFLERSRQNLAGMIRAGLNSDLALSNLMALIAHASDRNLCDQLNMTRKDALLEAIDLWACGALGTAYLPTTEFKPEES